MRTKRRALRLAAWSLWHTRSVRDARMTWRLYKPLTAADVRRFRDAASGGW